MVPQHGSSRPNRPAKLTHYWNSVIIIYWFVTIIQQILTFRAPRWRSAQGSDDKSPRRVSPLENGRLQPGGGAVLNIESKQIKMMSIACEEFVDTLKRKTTDDQRKA